MIKKNFVRRKQKKYSLSRLRSGLITLCLMLVLSLCSCTYIEKLTEKITGNDSGNTAEQSTPSSTAASGSAGADSLGEEADNVVFYVDSVPVTLGEWNLYALPRIGEYASLYGDTLWSYRVDGSGKEFREVFKEDVLEEIAYTKLVASQAAGMGITLSEDDNLEISVNIADYLDKMTRKQREQYHITEEVLKTVYSDNILALKVYERITLNIDTKIDDKEVRHMVLQYVMLPKTYENSEGETQVYEGTELEILRTRFNNYKQFLNGQPGITLKAAEYADFTATQIIADYNDLLDKFPTELADGIFALTDGEISEVRETDEGFFLFDCIRSNEEEYTNEARIEALEQRERDCFNEQYESWSSESVIIKNDKLWHELRYPE